MAAAHTETPSGDVQPTLVQIHEASPSPAAEMPSMGSRRFGDYELLEEIARGGMGVVYRARQPGLNRIVALKMILAGQLAGPDEVQRFRLEAKAAARLRHPNIVGIYEVGEHEGQHFFSMEYVGADSLDGLLVKGVLPGRTAARYMEKVARAVHYAHENGILHRDLKPANVLLDEQDQPKITDFGLAKVLARKGADATGASSSELTRTGVVVGTPSYMAPEQASGDAGTLGPAIDVYGLGAVLYELLTGRPPFKAESPVETILQLLYQDAVPPRVLNRKVDSDLEAICLKCLEKDPKLRYASAEALADDLHRYLQGEAVAASGINLFERLSRTLAHSPHDKEFRNWGQGLMCFGIIIFLAHAATSFMLLWKWPEGLCYWGPRIAQFLLLGLILWFGRPRSLLPTSTAERLIWAVWIGYFIAYAFMAQVFAVLGQGHLASYSASILLTGLAFFVMGCHVWGWCYVMGLMFMAVSPFMAYLHDKPIAIWCPLWFGAMWGLALLTIGLRYWHMGEGK